MVPVVRRRTTGVFHCPLAADCVVVKGWGGFGFRSRYVGGCTRIRLTFVNFDARFSLVVSRLHREEGQDGKQDQQIDNIQLLDSVRR